jgi:CheY-like chemotaxis protein
MKPARILVVDDNATNLKLVTRLLQLEGHELTTATSAEAARPLIGQSPPSLILMDIALPGMDGLTFTRQLKADPATRQIQVVALTAYAMKGDEEKALAAGCDGYLAKPIDTRLFPAQVAAWLKQSIES